MLDLIHQAIKKGAQVFPNISGGKDGQAMMRALHDNGVKMSAAVHADLGRIEWPESLPMCKKLSDEYGLDLAVIKRSDGRGLIEHWVDRMNKLSYPACDIVTRQEIVIRDKPFWSSSQSRYCTSDLKRDPIDKFYRNLHNDFIISAEGIRAQESTERGKKIPLAIRSRITHPYYDGMSVEVAIKRYRPGKRLALTWYPVFNFSIDDVWATYGMNKNKLAAARYIYRQTGEVPEWWPFHPAYVYGNERVSCKFCILGCMGDLQTAAEHHPETLEELIELEEISGYTFKKDFSLKQVRKALRA